MRIPNTDLILIPGHIHPEQRTIESVIEDDISFMGVDGNLVEGRLNPLGERFIHTEIYKVRKDVGAVIHAYPKVINVEHKRGEGYLLYTPLTP